MMSFPTKKPADAGADLLDEEYRLDDRVCAAFDVACKLMNVILRQPGIRRCDLEQPLHEIDETDERNKKEQTRDQDRDDDPDGGDRRPAGNVAPLIERSDVDDHDQRDDEQRGQRDGQDDLPGQLFAMFEIGFVNGLRKFGFHHAYFNLSSGQGFGIVLDTDFFRKFTDFFRPFRAIRVPKMLIPN